MLTGDMLRRAAHRFPNKAAILWNDTALSYRALNEQANRLAHALLAGGLQKQGKVGIISRNRPEYGVVFFGVAKSGGVIVNVSVLYAPDELAFWPGLLRIDPAAEQHGSDRLSLLRVFGQLHAARPTASADVHLRLDDQARPPRGGGPGGSKRPPPAKDPDVRSVLS